MSDSRWRLERRGRRDSIGAGRTVARSYQTKHIFVSRDFLSRPLSNIQRSLHALREAGTLPRSQRIKWGAGRPDGPLQMPSGTESMRMNAALALVHASSSRRLATRSHEAHSRTLTTGKLVSTPNARCPASPPRASGDLRILSHLLGARKERDEPVLVHV